MYTGKHMALAASFLLGIAAQAHAQDLSSAAQFGSGGAAIGDPYSQDASVENPGLVDLRERYDIGVDAGLGGGGYMLGASIVDSRESTIGLGVRYRRSVTDPEPTGDELPGWIGQGEDIPNVHRIHQIAAGLGYAPIPEVLSLGLGGNIDFTHNDRQSWKVVGDMTAGIAYSPDTILGFGLVAKNLLPIPDQDDSPFTLGLGGWIGDRDRGRLAIDVLERIEGGTQTQIRAGGELVIRGVVPRAGFDWTKDATHLTWGIGGQNEAGSVDYGMSIPMGQKIVLGSLVHRIGIRIKT